VSCSWGFPLCSWKGACLQPGGATVKEQLSQLSPGTPSTPVDAAGTQFQLTACKWRAIQPTGAAGCRHQVQVCV
jgi:hypothetical protein